MSSSSDRTGRASLMVRPIRVEAVQPARGAFAPARFDEQLVDARFVDQNAEQGPTAEEAWSAGYDTGLQEGMAIGRASTAAEQAAADRRVAALCDTLRTSADRIVDAQLRSADEITDLLIDTAFEIARAIVERELRDRPRTGDEALRTALALAPEHIECIARLNPADIDELHEMLGGEDFVDRVGHRPVTLLADASIEPGDCVVDLPAGRIELRLHDALERVRAVLKGDDHADLAEAVR